MPMSSHPGRHSYSTVLSALHKTELIQLSLEFKLPTNGPVITLKNCLKCYLNFHCKMLMNSHNPYLQKSTFYQLFSSNRTWPITILASSAPTQCPPYISLKAPLHIHHPPQLQDEVLVQGLYCSELHYYSEACQPFYTEKVTSSIGILAQLSEHWVFHYAVHIISSDFYLY